MHESTVSCEGAHGDCTQHYEHYQSDVGRKGCSGAVEGTRGLLDSTVTTGALAVACVWRTSLSFCSVVFLLTNISANYEKLKRKSVFFGGYWCHEREPKVVRCMYSFTWHAYPVTWHDLCRSQKTALGTGTGGPTMNQ